MVARVLHTVSLYLHVTPAFPQQETEKVVMTNNGPYKMDNIQMQRQPVWQPNPLDWRPTPPEDNQLVPVDPKAFVPRRPGTLDYTLWRDVTTSDDEDVDEQKGPPLKFWSFFPGWRRLKQKKKRDNELFMYRIAEMAAKGENGVKPLKDHDNRTLMYYVVHESGNGTDVNMPWGQCNVSYKAQTISGKIIYNWFDHGIRGTYFAESEIKLKDVMVGWREPLTHMVEGDMWEIYVPHDMMYGEWGFAEKSIGGYATIVLLVKMDIITGDSLPYEEVWGTQLPGEEYRTSTTTTTVKKRSLTGYEAPPKREAWNKLYALDPRGICFEYSHRVIAVSALAWMFALIGLRRSHSFQKLVWGWQLPLMHTFEN